MIIVKKADDLMKILDPMIGTAGKDADVTFNLAPTVVEVSVTDPARAVLCRMSADITMGYEDGTLGAYEIDKDISVTVPINTFAGIIKSFGSQEICLTMKDSTVIVSNDAAKRTFRLSNTDKTAKTLNIQYASYMQVGAQDLRRTVGMERISDGVTYHLNSDGKLTIGTYSDTESAEIYISTESYKSVKATYSSDILSDVIRRIHADDNIEIGMSNDMPMQLNYNFRCATFWIMVAPRIMSS